MLRVWLAAGAVVTGLAISGVFASLATAQATGDPASVIAAYEIARNRRDLDVALTYFADDATVSQRNATFAGRDEIRRFLEGTASRARFVVVSERRVSGNRVTWTERTGGFGSESQGRPQGFSGGPGFGGAPAFSIMVEAVVQDGKIRAISYVPTNQLVRSDASLDGRTQLPAAIGLGAVLIVLFGLLGGLSTGLRPSRTRASTLRGRLLQDLHLWRATRQQVR